MPEQIVIPPTEPKQLPMLSLYGLTCTPTNPDGQFFRNQDGVIWCQVIVSAETSTEATRKVINYFKTLCPNDAVKGIEVRDFRLMASAADTIVVV